MSDDQMDTVRNVLAAHYIECTGAGEVTCRCREGGWMSPASHRLHQANALHAAGVLRPVESSRSTAEQAVLDAADAETLAEDALEPISTHSLDYAPLHTKACVARSDRRRAVRALRAVVSPGDADTP